MKLACSVLFVALTIPAHGQEKKVTLPKDATTKLTAFLTTLKDGTEPEIKEFKGGFKKQRQVVMKIEKNSISNKQNVFADKEYRIRLYPDNSDFADKDYKIRINWEGTTQETKIFKSKAEAEKATQWEEAGKVVGTDNGSYIGPNGGHNYNATLYFAKGKWELESLKVQMYREVVTIEKNSGTKSPWFIKLSEAEKIQDKPKEKPKK